MTTFLLIQKKINLLQITKSVFVFVVISVTFGLYQFVKSKGDISTIDSTFANKNLLSSILYISFPFIIYSFGISKRWRILSAFLIILVTLMLWILQSKATLLVCVLFFSIIIIGSLSISLKRKNNLFINKYLLLTISSLIIFITILTIHNKNKFPHLFNFNETVNTRLKIWEKTNSMIEEHLAFGVGAGNWKIHFPKYGLNDFNIEVKNGTMIFQQPHNDFLWVFAEQGIFGGLVYLLIFILVFFYLFKLIRNTTDKKNQFLFISFFACIVGFIFISAVDFPMERIEHQTLLYLIFSIITAKYYISFDANKKTTTTSFNKPLLTALIGSVILFSFIVSINRYLGEYNTSKLYKAHRQGNWGRLIKIADKTINTYYFIDPMSIPIQWYKGVAQFSLGNIEDAKITFEKAYTLSPYNIHILNNLGSCWEKIGNHKKAEELYLKALSISSNFEEVRLNLSGVYYNSKQFDKAFDLIDKCSINGSDEKYKTFLSAILRTKIDIIISHHEGININQQKINELKNSEEKLLKLYFDSKNENISFDLFFEQNISKI